MGLGIGAYSILDCLSCELLENPRLVLLGAGNPQDVKTYFTAFHFTDVHVDPFYDRGQVGMPWCTDQCCPWLLPGRLSDTAAASMGAGAQRDLSQRGVLLGGRG